MRASSINDTHIDPDKIQFNESQKKLLYATTKYTTLLSIATISTWMLMLYGILSNITILNQIFLSGIACMDCAVNVICLYLQFPFNKEYYKKYCRCFGDLCACLFRRYLAAANNVKMIAELQTTASESQQV